MASLPAVPGGQRLSGHLKTGIPLGLEVLGHILMILFKWLQEVVMCPSLICKGLFVFDVYA